jgi:hypothetical protein
VGNHQLSRGRSTHLQAWQVLLPPTRFNSEAPFFVAIGPARAHPVLHLMGDAGAVQMAPHNSTRVSAGFE